MPKRTRGRGYFWEFLVGVCRPVLQILTDDHELISGQKLSFFTPVFERGIESNARVPLWQGLKFIAVSFKLCKIVQGQKKLQSNLQSLLNNERWKVLEALRNIFVESPQTCENRETADYHGLSMCDVILRTINHFIILIFFD